MLSVSYTEYIHKEYGEVTVVSLDFSEPRILKNISVEGPVGIDIQDEVLDWNEHLAVTKPSLLCTVLLQVVS